MSQEFHAIYEHGILRPLTPLDLPEATKVEVVLRIAGADSTVGDDRKVEILRQNEALNSMFAEIDAIPQTPNGDGLSGRDHDQILYGSPK
jgi:predicted DNA-binding antitoxin AbrB/MazE fold protein